MRNCIGMILIPVGRYMLFAFVVDRLQKRCTGSMILQVRRDKRIYVGIVLVGVCL